MRHTLLLLPLLVGCSELEPFLPKVTFDRMDVQDVSFEDIAADFVFRVENPNPVQVELASFSYALALEDVQLLEGDNQSGFTLENRGSSELSLPVDIVFAEAWDTVEATRGEDLVDFALDGHFGFDTPAGRARLPYSEAGDFPALRTPKFSFQKIRLTDLDLTTASLAVDLGVDNAHGSTLFFDNFKFSLDLGQDDVVSGLVSSFDVEGDTVGTVSLPLKVNLLTAGTTLLDAILDGGQIQLGLGASMDVDTPFGVIPLSIDETGKLAIQ